MHKINYITLLKTKNIQNKMIKTMNITHMQAVVTNNNQIIHKHQSDINKTINNSKTTNPSKPPLAPSKRYRKMSETQNNTF